MVRNCITSSLNVLTSECVHPACLHAPRSRQTEMFRTQDPRGLSTWRPSSVHRNDAAEGTLKFEGHYRASVQLIFPKGLERRGSHDWCSVSVVHGT